MNKKTTSVLLLFITSFIWGTSFVFQRLGMDHIEPFTFTFFRNIVSTLFLLPLIPYFSSKNPDKDKYQNKDLLIGGILCGVVLFIAGSLQQFGVKYTSAGKAGFITTLYIILVPIIGIFLKQKVSRKIWYCVMLATVGMYMLSIKESLSIEYGDFLVFLCAIAYSFHIIIIDYFSPKADGTKLSCIQFFVWGLLSFVAMILFETPTLNGVVAATVPIIFTGVLSSGIGYTFQIIAQKNVNPTLASLILSLESVFAVLSGIVLLSESFTTKELLGCALIFIAIIIAQLPDKKYS